MEHSWEARLHRWLSPCEDTTGWIRHSALEVFVLVALSGRNVFHRQPRTGVSTEPVPGFFFPPCTPRCLTGGKAVPWQQ